MAKFTRKNIFSARFVNDKRTDIEVLLKNNKTKTLDVYLVDTDPNDIEFQNLLKVYSLDDIEKDTAEFIEATTKADEEFRLNMIKQGRLEEEPSDNKIRLTLEESIGFFVDYKSDKKITKLNMTYEELLFNIKIHLFDLSEVENADDTFKESIRTADTPLGLLNIIHDAINQS